MVVERYTSSSVLFADIVGFTTLTVERPPEEIIQMLNTIFNEFDNLIEESGLEKIKTIGDAVMVAGAYPSIAKIIWKGQPNWL